jgi:2-desacetyl-2-hydroxyethyl bacteriochlorophyllide A dehydrogenase
MKALVLEEYNKLVYKDVPDPEPAPDEVIVRVKACGICGSDIHGLDGSTGRRIPPLIMGHEASGVISRTGSNVSLWKTGDRVTFDSTVYRLDDWYTRKGLYNLSDNREVLGVSPGTYRRNGAFAEYIAIPQHILYSIPDTVTFEQAAMVEAAAVAQHAINLSGIKPGASCAVVGTGMIGIFIVKLLKISGASAIIAIDTNPNQLKKAEKAGADMVLLTAEPDIEKKVKSITSGRGVDIAFEAVGKTDPVNTTFSITRRGGTVILVGNLSAEIQFPLQKVVTGEMTIRGSCAICGEYEIILDHLMKGRLSVDDQISAIAPLSEGAMWFERLLKKEEDLGKVILVP